MDIIQALALALLQGLTEFLPISSSAHLILLPVLLGWQDQGLAFDVAVHIGTLSAVMAFYRRDIITMTKAWFSSLTGGEASADSRLFWYVGFGTVPVGLAGLLISQQYENLLRAPLVIATATIVFALLLWFASRRAQERRKTITLIDVWVVSLFQALALIPGTSRSGITITAGLLTGLEREQAARFSFLLSIPVIGLAGLLKLIELLQSQVQVDWGLISIGAGVSAVVAYLTIGWFLRLFEKIGVMPFVWYRLLLGGFLIVVFFV